MGVKDREDELLRKVGEYVKEHLGEWLSESGVVESLHGVGSYEVGLRERTVRIEEGLRNQRELMQRGFGMMEKRFALMEKHFEQADKRFEEMLHYMDKRFEQVDKRFEHVDKRLENLDTRLTELSRRMFQFMVWSFSFTATAAGIVIGVLNF